MSSETSPLVEMRAAERRFQGRRVLGPIDLRLDTGRTVAVIGPNGAGKTTLLRLITGLLAPTGGEVCWQGADADRLGRRALARRIAYVPQVRPTAVPLTVEQMVMLGRFPHLDRWQLVPSGEDRAAVERALEQADLAPLAGRFLETLSGGERQSVYIAAALAQEAPLLVLDEPTTHLDPAHQSQVADLVLRLGRDSKRTVLIATHDLPLAAHVADRVLGVANGCLTADGSAREVLTPEVLSELFVATFEQVRGGERPLVMMTYDGSTR